jgi:hypothetical protein
LRHAHRRVILVDVSTRRVKVDVATVLGAVPNPSVVPSGDPVLAALAEANARRTKADEEVRLLLAYARQFVYPHPYTFGELATAAGMSVSGVRTAYSQQDVEKVAAATGMQPVATDGEEG